MKKHSLLLETQRIKEGLLNSKVYSGIGTWCEETYSGFLRALIRKTVYLINVEIDGKKKILLGKSFPGRLVVDSGYILEGYQNLLLDPKTLDVYTFLTNKKTGKIKIKDIISKERMYEEYSHIPDINFDLTISEIKKELPIYLKDLKSNYITHYESRFINKSPEKNERIKRRINTIFAREKISNFIGKSPHPIK